jgi:hypothetical protein
MKFRRNFCLVLAVGLALVLTEGVVFATGTASAAGEVTANTTRGEIQKDKGDRTGGLTVTAVKVLDKFGRHTRTLRRGENADYTVEGDTSTSPTIKFNASAKLENGEYCTVEMTSTKDGTHDLDIKFS